MMRRRSTSFPVAALATACVVAGIGGAAVGAKAAESQSMDQIIAASGKNDDKSFCGSKPIVLGIHDGFGISRPWSPP